MKYVAEIVSHITVEVQNREQAERSVAVVLSRLQNAAGDGVVFHTNSINRKHYHHMAHYYHSPNYGNLRHQHINVSRLKPGSVFAFWIKKSDMLVLYEKGHAGSWTSERWIDGTPSPLKEYVSDHDMLLRIDASNDHDPNALGYVVGMEHVADRDYIQLYHPDAMLIGYKVFTPQHHEN